MNKRLETWREIHASEMMGASACLATRLRREAGATSYVALHLTVGEGLLEKNRRVRTGMPLWLNHGTLAGIRVDVVLLRINLRRRKRKDWDLRRSEGPLLGTSVQSQNVGMVLSKSPQR